MRSISFSLLRRDDRARGPARARSPLLRALAAVPRPARGGLGRMRRGQNKENWRLIAGGYLRYFRECGYDLLPLLRKYAPHWAENFSAAREAYLAAAQGQKEAEERLFRITARHLAGKWYPLGGGAAALKYADILDCPITVKRRRDGKKRHAPTHTRRNSCARSAPRQTTHAPDNPRKNYGTPSKNLCTSTRTHT